MKKAIILAIITVFLVSFSVVFYYKTTDFSNGGERPIKEVNLAETYEKKKGEEKKKIEEKNEVETNKNDTVKNDVSICNENGKIMVLMYHKFAKTATDGWTRSFDDFKNDLQRLYDKGYYPINMGDYIEGKIDVPYGKTPVILTFDDGVASQLSFEWVEDEFSVKADTAVKIYQDFVKKHPDFPMKGTFYIMSTNFFGSKGTLKQRLEYLVNEGFEIGNQTQNHYALQKADSAEKVIEEVGGLAKFVDDLIPGYVISSFSIPGGSMTKKYAGEVYSGEYKGFKYENKGIVLLYGSKPALSPINKSIDLKSIPRVRVAGKDKVDKDFDYWLEYFDEHPEERYISDGKVNTFVVNSLDKDNVKDDDRLIIK